MKVQKRMVLDNAEFFWERVGVGYGIGRHPLETKRSWFLAPWESLQGERAETKTTHHSYVV